MAELREDPTTELRVRLLQETLRQAVEHSPFYRNLYRGLSTTVEDLEGLAALPTIDKRMLAASGRDVQTDSSFPRRIGFTSGTDYDASRGGEQLLLRTFQSDEELVQFEALQQFFHDRRPERPGLVLVLISSFHGLPFTRPAPGVFSLPLGLPFHYAHARQLLLERHAFDGFGPRIEAMLGSVVQIKLLTTLLLREPESVLADLAIGSIYTRSWYLPRRWRKLLVETFGARVTSVYGLSEVAGSTMSECLSCGDFHPAPELVSEVLALDSDAPAPPGTVGELTLTSLVPFCSLQPKIRYRTGDLVQTMPRCDLVADARFRLLGRKRRGLYEAGTRRLLLDSHSVYDAIESLPDVALTPFPELEPFDVGRSFGRPRYRATTEEVGGRTAVVLDVETTYHPRFFPDRSRSVGDLLHERLQTAHARLPGNTSPLDDIRVNLHPAGALPKEVAELL